MSRLTLAGLLFGVLGVVGYVCFAYRCRAKPDLARATNIFISFVSLAATVRLLGFALSGEFADSLKAQPQGNSWSVSADDTLFIVLGSLALAWVSVQTVWAYYDELVKSARARPTSG